MPLVRILEHGQVTIPKKFRDALGLKKGDVAEAELLKDGRIVLTPKRLVREKAWDDLVALLDKVHEKNRGIREDEVLDEVIKAVEEYRAEKQAKRG